MSHTEPALFVLLPEIPCPQWPFWVQNVILRYSLERTLETGVERFSKRKGELNDKGECRKFQVKGMEEWCGRVTHLFGHGPSFFILSSSIKKKSVQWGIAPYACDPGTWEDCHEFGAGPGYLVGSRPAWTTEEDPFSLKQQQRNEIKECRCRWSYSPVPKLQKLKTCGHNDCLKPVVAMPLLALKLMWWKGWSRWCKEVWNWPHALLLSFLLSLPMR